MRAKYGTFRNQRPQGMIKRPKAHKPLKIKIRQQPNKVEQYSKMEDLGIRPAAASELAQLPPDPTSRKLEFNEPASPEPDDTVK